MIYFYGPYEDYKREGLITERKHPEYDLYVLTYTTKTVVENRWDKYLLQCRSLVINDMDQIVAKSFDKFFNFDEQPNATKRILDEEVEVEVLEKVDGSMITVFNYYGDWIFVSKSSFTSRHVEWAQEVFRVQYGDPDVILDPKLVYTFELIHPENRIVVDYGDMKRMVLICVRNQETMEEISVQEFRHKFDTPTVYDMLPPVEIKDLEGFVVKYSKGSRLKWKHEWYVDAHRIKNLINKVDLTKELMMYKSSTFLFNAMRVITKFGTFWRDEVSAMVFEIFREYRELESFYFSTYVHIVTKMMFKNEDLLERREYRKRFAEYAKRYVDETHPIGPLFAMFDGKPMLHIYLKVLLKHYIEERKNGQNNFTS